MSFRYLEGAFAIKGLRSTEQLVLLHLANIADESGYLFAGNELLAMRSGLSERTVRRDITAMKKTGLLRRVNRPYTSPETWLLYDVRDWSKQ